MPRQVRKTTSSPAVRTVAQTRATSALASLSASGSASGSGSRRSTRASLRKASSTVGLQLASSTSSSSPQQTPQRAPLTAGPPAVRQLRSRQVPLAPQDVCRSSDAVKLIFVQGKRRRSRSVASSRASESACNTADTARGSRTTRATRDTSRLRLSTARTPRSLTRLTRPSDARSLSLAQSIPQNRTIKTAIGKKDKQPAEETPVACPVCQEKLSPSVIEAHTSVCNLYLCPLASDNTCQWRGTISQSVDHIVKNHRTVHCVAGPNASIVLKSWRKAAPLHWTNLQTCLGHNFLVEIKKVEIFNRYPYFYGVVRLFGHQEDADRFEYRMMMKTRGKMARVFSYSTIVRALHNDNSVINKDDSFVFDSSQAEIFSYEGNVEIEISISVMKM